MHANLEKPPRKQQQRSIRTKQKLLDAALEAFSENGFQGTSTRNIAERAGVHHPLITYHFKNKEELWRAAADRIFTEFNVALAAAAEAQEGECLKVRMSAMIRAYVHYAAGQPALHKIMVQEASRPSRRRTSAARQQDGLGIFEIKHRCHGDPPVDRRGARPRR